MSVVRYRVCWTRELTYTQTFSALFLSLNLQTKLFSLCFFFFSTSLSRLCDHIWLCVFVCVWGVCVCIQYTTINHMESIPHIEIHLSVERVFLSFIWAVGYYVFYILYKMYSMPLRSLHNYVQPFSSTFYNIFMYVCHIYVCMYVSNENDFENFPPEYHPYFVRETIAYQ